MSDLDDLTVRISAFVEARGWSRHHLPKNLTLALTAEVGELAELVQWLTPEEEMSAGADPALRRSFEDEMADVLIYLVSLAKVLEIDLLGAAQAKIERNEHRFPITRPATGPGEQFRR